MVKSVFTIISGHSTDEDSWVYLVDWILALFLSLGFIFYFSRLVGFVISILLKLTLWRKCKVRINIEACNISFVGGRIFIKNLTIMTQDYTISVLKLTFTWQYWFTLTRSSAIHYSKDFERKFHISHLENKKLPSRFKVLLEGCEVFIYNRQAAYDRLFEIIEENSSNSSYERGPKVSSDNLSSRSSDRSEGFASEISAEKEYSKAPSGMFQRNSKNAQNKSSVQSDNMLKFLMKFLPVGLRIKNGTVVVGNKDTPSILAFFYTEANGILDIEEAGNSLDRFRIIHNFKCDDLKISLKNNIGFHNSNIHNSKQNYHMSESPGSNPTQNKKLRYIYNFFHSIRLLRDFVRRKGGREDENFTKMNSEWKGLKRYISSDGSRMLHEFQTNEEYAKISTIFDSKSVKFSYYYDLPGIIPEYVEPNFKVGSPEIGLIVQLSNATIHYGPWAERHRMPLQSRFFPSSSYDTKVSKRTAIPGELRSSKGFRFLMECENELIFRIPTREPSKYKDIIDSIKKANGGRNNYKETVPFGWVELGIKEKSSFTYFVSYAPTDSGWHNKLNIIMIKPEVRSSVNHDVFFMAEKHIIDCDLTIPLVWNAACHWKFNNNTLNGKIFLLREHVTLISDVFADFGSGVPAPYEKLRIYKYNINWEFESYKIYLNVNYKNIINNPLDFASNSYLSFQGEDLSCSIHIPLLGRLSKKTKVGYTMYSSCTKIILDTPPWHTTHFVKSKIMGIAHDLNIEASYTYMSQVEVATTNLNFIKVSGDYVTLKFYGFLVKYLFSVKENYFGDNVHFMTVEEYNQEISDPSSGDESSSISGSNDMKLGKQLIKAKNDVDTIFSFNIRHGLMILPYHFYDVSSHVALRFDSFNIDMRLSTVYSDLQADFSPLSAKFYEETSGWDESREFETIFNIEQYDKMFDNTNADLFIDGFIIHSHRMFGLPPHEFTYYSKWDFATEGITIESDSKFLIVFVNCIRYFIFQFKDTENSLSSNSFVSPNVANFAFRSPHVKMRLRSDKNNISLPLFDFNLRSVLFATQELANSRYSTKLSLSVSSITCEVSSIQDDRKVILGYFSGKLILHRIVQNRKFEEDRKFQQDFVRKNDAPFHRCPFLIDEEARDKEYNDAEGTIISPITLKNVSEPLNAFGYWTEKNIEDDSESGVSFDEYSSFNQSVDSEASSFSTNADDYYPSYEVDPRFKYSTFIIDMGELDIFATTESIEATIDMILASLDLSIIAIVDSLHLAIAEELRNHILSPSNVLNFRLVTPSINFKYSHFPVESYTQVFHKSPTIPLLNVSIMDLACSWSIRSDFTDVSKTSKIIPTSMISLKEVDISLSKDSSFVLPLFIKLLDSEIWFSGDPEMENLGADASDVNVTLDVDHVGFVLGFIELSMSKLASTIKKMGTISNIFQSKLIRFIYDVTLAGEEFHIDHDPEVLTKPAYILRSQKNHVRLFDSWKMLTRVRHIVNNLPKEWIDAHNIKLKDFDKSLPSGMYERVYNVFSNWRSWEMSDVEGSYFFEYIFERSQKTSFNKNNRLRIANVAINLRSDIREADFIRIRDFSSSRQKVIAIKLGSTTDDSKERDSRPVLFLDEYQSKLGFNSIDLAKEMLPFVKKIQKIMSLHSNEKDTVNHANWLKDDTSFYFYCSKANQSIMLNDAKLEFKAINLETLFFKTDLNSSERSCYNSITISSDFLQLVLSTNLQALASLQIYHVFLNVVGAEKVAKLQPNIVCSISKVELFNFALQEDASEILGSLSKSFKILESVISSQKKDVTKAVRKSKTTKSINSEDINYSNIKLNINQIEISIEPIELVRLNVSISDFVLSTNFEEKCQILMTKIHSIKWVVRVSKVAVLDASISKIESKTKFLKTADDYFIFISLGSGFTQVFIPSVLNSIELLDRSAKSLNSPKNWIQLLTAERSYEQPSSNSLWKKMHFKTTISSEYFGISTDIELSTLSLEIENFNSEVSNLSSKGSKRAANKNGNSMYHGFVSVPALRFSIFDHSIPTGLSNILNLNFFVQIFDNKDENDILQSLQIESQFFRICLNPLSITRIMSIYDQILAKVDKLEHLNKLELYSPTDKTEVSNNLSSLFNISIVHVLCYNFCFGLLFADPQKAHPGIILGAERFFAVGENEMGKFTLLRSYVSAAKGYRSSDFFGTDSSNEPANGALLPRMQLIYTVEKTNNSRDLKIKVIGDELGIKFLSESVSIIHLLSNLILKLQAALKSSDRDFKSREVLISSSKDADLLNRFKGYFSSVECILNFAGSKIVVDRLSETQNDDHDQSLNFHLPAIKVATLYKFDEKIKHQMIMTEIYASPSDNTLYPSSVPVMLELIGSFKKLANIYRAEENNKLQVLEKSYAKGKITDLMREFNVHVSLKIGKQRLSLSCEPTAKVEAVVGIDNINIIVDSNLNQESLISCSIRVDSIFTSLQHIYSREVSGSFMVDSLLFNLNVFSEPSFILYSTGLMSTIELYMNVRQIQDLSLFKDIWFPKKRFRKDELGPMNRKSIHSLKSSDLASVKSIATRFKEVSTTSAFPWVLNLIVPKVKLETNLGKALGIATFNWRNFWAISRRTVDWRHDIQIGLEYFSLTSVGRLGGLVEGSEFYSQIVIDWKFDSERTLDVPLIVLSTGIQKLQMKLIFDTHIFFMYHMKDISIDVFNQKDMENISKDHLFGTVNFAELEVHITSLTASTILDIYSVIDRITQEARKSYKETLKESNKNRKESINPGVESNYRILEMVKKLETKLQLIAATIVIYIYPTSFNDTKVLICRVNQSSVNFHENEYSQGISNKLDFELRGIKVQLSKTHSVSEDFVESSSVDDFRNNASKATGGNIFLFPSFKASMKCFQNYNSNVIKYLYYSSFGGIIDISWNLGSVNFIRDMWNIHVSAFSSRMSLRSKTSKINFKLDKQESNAVPFDISNSKYEYVPLVPPVIESPQIKELGSATPPLEWFGLHRQEFPGLTHGVAIATLQKFVHAMDKQYSKFLDRA